MDFIFTLVLTDLFWMVHFQNFCNFFHLKALEFKHGRTRWVPETALTVKIITNQTNQQSSILSQKYKIKMTRSKRSYRNKASNTETQNNTPTSSSDH